MGIMGDHSGEGSGIKLFGKTISLQNKNINMNNRESESESEEEKTMENMKRPEKIIACPRCKSMETKFCYFNNYNVNQPRHFCKGCQRYWTAGGALRNVPVGAGRRKVKPQTTNDHHHTQNDNNNNMVMLHHIDFDWQWHSSAAAFRLGKRRRTDSGTPTSAQSSFL